MTRIGRVVVTVALLAPGTVAGQVELPRWTVTSEPLTTIGAIDGPEEEIFAAIQGGLLLADGTIVVREGLRGIFEIRYFSEDGVHLASAGRSGQGPFELEFASGTHLLPGDSVFLPGTDGRYAIFGPRGERFDEGRLPDLPVGPMRSHLGNGFLAFLLPEPGGGRMPRAGTYRDTWDVATYELETGELQRIAKIEGGPSVYAYPDGPERVFYLPYPFGGDAHIAVHGDRVWIAEPHEPTIRGLNRDGELEVVIELDAPRAVTDEDRSQFRDWVLRTAEVRGPLWRRYANDVEFPEHHPHLGGLEIDRDGNLWVQRAESPWDEGPRIYDVYSPRGARFASVEFPSTGLNFCTRHPQSSCDSILWIDDDRILVNYLERGGAPQVRVYGLDRGAH